MPDGKRNSLTAEEETDGFYEEDNIPKVTSSPPAKRLPINFNTRGLNNLSERLLKAMVANEIKKTLDPEDNRKLVANHRPVLHSDNEQSNGESDNMVVVGVVLNAKQTQNEDVSKALDILRKNGVTCVCFSLKDSQSPPNGVKKDGGSKSPDENSTSPIDELSPDVPKAEKKVSSPTVSTTSDYASPPPPTPPPEDISCTSTTSPIEPNEDESVHKEPFVGKAGKRKGNKRKGKSLAEKLTGPPILSPNPPQVTDPLRGEQESESGPSLVVPEEDLKASSSSVKRKADTDIAVQQRKKRRRRLYPYLSRRKSKSKKKKVEVKAPLVQVVEEVVQENEVESISIESPTIELSESPSDQTLPATSLVIPEKKADPYEFEDSDLETSDSTALETFKTPLPRSSPKKVTSPNEKVAPAPQPPSKKKSKGKASKKKKSVKVGSPRKKLTFSKNRSFSPDITDHVSCRPRRGVPFTAPSSEVEDKKVDQMKLSSNSESSSNDSCVQTISAAEKKCIINTDTIAEINDDKSLVLPHSQRESQLATAISLPLCHDSDVCTDKKGTIKDNKGSSSSDKATPQSIAQQIPSASNVQIKDESNDKNEFLVPPIPSDSLQDTPDSMQLRRSSFYTSISRNVQINLDNYLDGRPPDLKVPKRSKKFKNGFLLHHGDNFPDDPEAPYRLHLATQVLLKLNKRRVKCKPKEDKGKSLLSYLKLQPKRVSRVGKHSAKQEDGESSTSAAEQTTSVFSGEWTVPRKYICNICGQVENAFWDMVMHKGEVHPGIVVTHVELSSDPPEGFRIPPSPRQPAVLPGPTPCTKCGATFTEIGDLHLHIFECAGNLKALEDNTKIVTTSSATTGKKKKGKRKRGFKRRINGSAKKNAAANNAKQESNNSTLPEQSETKPAEITKRRNSEVFKCEFCTREFKTEGWLKNHVSLSHSLPISIPLAKLSLPTRASINSSRRFSAQIACNNIKGSKPVYRET